MTIDRASVAEGARLAAEARRPWYRFKELASSENDHDARYMAHWNPEFAVELARELQRLWRVEEAAKIVAGIWESDPRLSAPLVELRAALANQAAEEGTIPGGLIHQPSRREMGVDAPDFG